jgi:hypothetical protein
VRESLAAPGVGDRFGWLASLRVVALMSGLFGCHEWDGPEGLRADAARPFRRQVWLTRLASLATVLWFALRNQSVP